VDVNVATYNNEPGTTTGYIHNHTGSCGGGVSPDRVYSFNVSVDASQVTVEVSGFTGLRFYLTGEPCGITELTDGCIENNDGWYSVEDLDVGTYYVIVDGLDSADQFGDFVIWIGLD
jgi:hypothetical protein